MILSPVTEICDPGFSDLKKTMRMMRRKRVETKKMMMTASNTSLMLLVCSTKIISRWKYAAAVQ